MDCIQEEYTKHTHTQLHTETRGHYTTAWVVSSLSLARSVFHPLIPFNNDTLTNTYVSCALRTLFILCIQRPHYHCTSLDDYHRNGEIIETLWSGFVPLFSLLVAERRHCPHYHFPFNQSSWLDKRYINSLRCFVNFYIQISKEKVRKISSV